MSTDSNAEKDRLKDYMIPRFTGLVSVVKDQRDDEVYPLCSGVLLILEDYPVLLTVAHYLKDVLKWKNQGRLEQLAIIVHRDASGSTPVILELQSEAIVMSDNYDIGCLILSHAELKTVLDQGGVLLDAGMFSRRDDTPEMSILAGHSSALSRTRQETIANDDHREWQMITLTNITLALVAVADFKDSDTKGTLRYTPVKQNLDTYVGLSGGPVFGFRRGTENIEIQIVAIQSAQSMKGATLTSLVGTHGDVAVLEAKRLLDSMAS